MRNTPKIDTGKKASFNQSERDFLTMMPGFFCNSIEESINSIDETVSKANIYASYRQIGIKDSDRSELMYKIAHGIK